MFIIDIDADIDTDIDIKNYKTMVKCKYKILKITLNKNKVKIYLLAYIQNESKQEIGKVKFYIDQKLYKECNLKQYNKSISKLEKFKKENIHVFEFKIDDIIKDESIINSNIKFSIEINDEEVDYKIKIKENIKPKYYYVPIKSIYIKDYAIHIRRTYNGNLIFVKRLKEDIEKTKRFKIFESKLVSFLFYNIGKILSKLRRRKINLFYEKFASKAEEGVYELYQKCNQGTKTRNYFIIDENSPDYENIKNDINVVTKYSLKYYWLIYNCKYFIASEAPGHLNVLRSNNKYFRKAICDKKFIFLQHGIIYMKNLGINSTFKVGKEAESQYMVVSSEKEKEVVKEMLGYKEEQLLKTGLAMYSKIEYNHINTNSDDIVTVMLTWKPYEEQLQDFSESSYYKNVIEIVNILQKYIDKKQIIIVAHPKIYNLMKNTDLKEVVWNGAISEVLKKTKLLITDYSSVCYNAFYQGAGVIFYQEDIEYYEAENGKLIPNNEEYIGKRAFNINDFESIIKNAIVDKKIILNNIRTKEHECMYKTINEFSDGKNIDRIYESLKKLRIV